jgi:DNA-binding NtrC family response regulator
MPGMNGVESFFKMKEKNPNIRVILFTAYSLEDLIRRAREGGAWEVLAKPLDMERLFESIEAAMKSGAGGCILLADDDKGFCDNLVDTLTQAGFRVATAFDGNEAVTMAQGKSFDVLLLDMKLPQLNGLEVYRRVKQYQPNLVTIIITGYAEEMGELITQALNENAYTCLRKPLEMGELFGLLKEICSRKSKGTVQKHSKRGP